MQLHCAHTLTHIHTNRWGCAFLQVLCIKPQWKTTERKECVCKIERGVVEDYKGSEKQKRVMERRQTRTHKKKDECVIQKKELT